MITLANINEFADQEIFEQCATHLLQQGKQAKGEGRGRKCLKCAVGCFIPDEDYSPYVSYTFLIRDGFYPDVDSSKLKLLRRLQVIHDYAADHPLRWRSKTSLNVVPRMWKDLLLELAKDYELDATFINNLPAKTGETL